MFRKTIKVPVEVSARHCHLSKESLETLFGVGYELKILKQLTQPSDFASQETIDIQFGVQRIERVRVVGPTRNQTQIEISKTDAFFLGINPPLRLSGNLEGSSAVILKGPKGQVELKEGLIIARRHIHCSAKEAKEIGLKQGQLVSVEIKGDRATTFHSIEVRTGENYKLCLHLDADEGNAAGINKVGEGQIIK